MGKAKRKNVNVREYRPSAAWCMFYSYSLLFSIPPVIVLFGGGIILIRDGVWSVAALAFFMGYLVFCWLWLSYQAAYVMRLVVSPHGITVHGYGERFYPWNSLVGFGRKGVLQGNAWGITTTHPKRIHNTRWQQLLLFEWLVRQFVPLSGIVRVPKSWRTGGINMEKFKQTPLGQDLLHYAPHLFDDDKAKKGQR